MRVDNFYIQEDSMQTGMTYVTGITQAIDSNSGHDELATAKAVFDAIASPVSHSNLTNRIYVSPTASGADFTTIADAVAWFNTSGASDTELILDGGTHLIPSSIEINSSYALNIKGLGSDVTTLDVSEVGKTFEVKSKVTFSRLYLNGPGAGTGAVCFHIENRYYCEFYDFRADFYDKVFVDSEKGSTFLFNFLITNSNIAYEINTNKTGGSVDIEVGTIESTITGINLLFGQKDFIINSVYFIGKNPTDTFVKIDPSYFKINDIANIQNCGGNSTGLFQLGFDFSASTGIHADVEMIGNSIYENKLPHFKVNVENNTGVTVVSTAGTYYKAVFANGTSYTTKMKLENNKYTYLSSHKKDMPVWITGNLSVDNPNRNVTVGILVDGIGSIISPFTVRTTTAGQPYPFSFMAYLRDLDQNNFFEIHLTSSTNGDNITIQDLNIFALAL